ncbi:MAG: S1 family peptidase [Pseudobdellovibrionaceae bacterium]|nr:S1 family peptidase [Pseudobdellovibrionaceae bacterium]
MIEEEGTLPSQWPSAKIDKTYVWNGDPVVIAGYGCESGTSSSGASSTVRKKFGRTSVLAGSVINDLEPRVSEANMNNFESYYFMTPCAHYNYESSPNNVSLCPGDSGGPVYRDSTAEVVVGIHSSYIFYLADDYSWANRHTRLVDPWQGTDVLPWLESFLPDSSFTTTPL